MPPKKKGKKKKDDAELKLEEKYQRTMGEIEALKDQLSKRKEVARRAKSAGLELKDKMKEAEQLLTTQQADQKSVSADMTRQYKTMQTEMNLRIHQLESERDRLQIELEKTQTTLQTTIKVKDDEIAQRDRRIADLNMQMRDLKKDIGVLVQDSFTTLLLKLEEARKNWEEKSTLIQARNKQVLMEFHLNPLEI
ncbi:dynein regulatory complex protein 12-like [Watersipora subatra]|uniref:dynein regulatory complex protein 12-like n=1 Tax=Watersipora subatra TaxID=2589382 RepID=UPI00355BFA87